MLVRPERAYFGEKDYQQLELVEGMAHAFFLDTEIVPCPTPARARRPRDELAQPAAHARGARARAGAFIACSRRASRAAAPAEAASALARAGFDVEYVADHDGRRLAAVRLGQVRLIDNVEHASNQSSCSC